MNSNTVSRKENLGKKEQVLTLVSAKTILESKRARNEELRQSSLRFIVDGFLDANLKKEIDHLKSEIKNLSDQEAVEIILDNVDQIEDSLNVQEQEKKGIVERLLCFFKAK